MIVYLAKSQEPVGLPGEPPLTQVAVVGVFSTRELAQSALEQRAVRFRGVTLREDWKIAAIGGLAVTDDLAVQWSRYLVWDNHPEEDDVLWQLVEIREVDRAD